MINYSIVKNGMRYHISVRSLYFIKTLTYYTICTYNKLTSCDSRVGQVTAEVVVVVVILG